MKKYILSLLCFTILSSQTICMQEQAQNSSLFNQIFDGRNTIIIGLGIFLYESLKLLRSEQEERGILSSACERNQIYKDRDGRYTDSRYKISAGKLENENKDLKVENTCLKAENELLAKALSAIQQKHPEAFASSALKK